MPPVVLQSQSSTVVNGQDCTTTVNVTNPSDSIAFAVSITLESAAGETISPVFLSDNYFTMMPKSGKVVQGTYQLPAADDNSFKPVVVVRTYNNVVTA